MSKIERGEWQWFGNAGHFICGNDCRFHLFTRVGDYLISTVGEYWPDSQVRKIHANFHDPEWLRANAHLKGYHFDAAYRERFGFEKIGYDRTYETMVFRMGGECECGCGQPQIDPSELDCEGRNAQRKRTRHTCGCARSGRR